MADTLVNELTGEELTAADYVTANRSIERRIFRLDNTLADLKSTLRATKEERDKEVAALRANAREIRFLKNSRASKRKAKS